MWSQTTLDDVEHPRLSSFKRKLVHINESYPHDDQMAGAVVRRSKIPRYFTHFDDEATHGRGQSNMKILTTIDVPQPSDDHIWKSGTVIYRNKLSKYPKYVT